jgi:hypothetical protein
MKKIVFIFCILFSIIFYIIFSQTFFKYHKLGLAFIGFSSDTENQCFVKTYNQISDSMITSWDSVFTERGIKNNGFAIMIDFIKFFSEMKYTEPEGCLTLNKIISGKKTNIKSSAIATCAIMQRLGWDIQCFYNEDECYLGVNLDEHWKVRKANWVEKDEKIYYLKQFDGHTPVGALKRDNPASRYQSLRTQKTNLRPMFLINNLPKFSGPAYKKRLIWWYQGMKYDKNIFLPQEQVEWSKNLPPSLYGMAYSGIKEIVNTGLTDTLKSLINKSAEYDRVDFLFKFCQSDSIFIYDNTEPIKSVSRQLLDGRNDCDGRSVFLYCLLRTVLEYSGSDVVFVSWPNHIALGLRPQTDEARKILKEKGFHLGDGYYVLDASYTGDTHWGSKMERLQDRCELIR